MFLLGSAANPKKDISVYCRLPLAAFRTSPYAHGDITSEKSTLHCSTGKLSQYHLDFNYINFHVYYGNGNKTFLLQVKYNVVKMGYIENNIIDTVAQQNIVGYLSPFIMTIQTVL